MSICWLGVIQSMTDNKCRGCFFCRNGKEAEVVQRFHATFPDSRAIFPTCTRYWRAKKEAVEYQVPLMPGYVFFEMDASQTDVPSPQVDDRYQYLQSIDASLVDFSRSAHVLKLLRYANDGWRLQGSDDAFVQTLCSVEGNIGISQARFDEGDRIRILNGFLKDYEGCITRVNRKARTVEVSIDFHEKKVRMWLGYELVSKAGSCT